MFQQPWNVTPTLCYPISPLGCSQHSLKHTWVKSHHRFFFQALFTALLWTEKWSRISCSFLERALKTLSEEILCHIQVSKRNPNSRDMHPGDIYSAPPHRVVNSRQQHIHTYIHAYTSRGHRLIPKSQCCLYQHFCKRYPHGKSSHCNKTEGIYFYNIALLSSRERLASEPQSGHTISLTLIQDLNCGDFCVCMCVAVALCVFLFSCCLATRILKQGLF